jgi:hypothetical protein
MFQNIESDLKILYSSLEATSPVFRLTAPSPNRKRLDMKWALALVVLVAPGVLGAQNSSTPFRYRGSGYAVFGGGACQHGVGHISAGGGGEGFVVKGLSLGLDAAYRKFTDDPAFGTAVLTVGYHFVDRTEPAKIDPFISVAPLGIAFRVGNRSQTEAAGHIAGGLNYWMKPRMGVRFEGGIYGLASEAIFLVRLGVSFR